MSTFDPSNQRLDPPEPNPRQTHSQSSRFQSHLQPPSSDHQLQQQQHHHQDHTHQNAQKNQDRYSIAHTKGAPKGVEQTQKKPGLMGLGHGFPGASGRNTPSPSQGQRTSNGQSFDEASIRRIVQEEFKKKNFHNNSDQKEQHQKSGLNKGSKFDENETFDQIGIDIKQPGGKKQQSNDSNVKESGEKAFDLDDSRGSKTHKGGTKFYEEGHDGLNRQNVISRTFADESDQVAIGDGDGNSIRILDEGTLFPNPWTRLRYVLREGLAEMIGTFILVLFGNGVNAQVTVSSLYDAAQPKGQFLSIAFGWGIGIGLGVWACGGISGGMINPAVTLSIAIFRKFSWWKVLYYIIFQILGAFLGALCIYGVYVIPIRIVDPDQTELTAGIFCTFPAPFLRTSTSTRLISFYNEVLATMVLMIIILAIGDSNNTPPVDGMAPLVLLWAVTGIGSVLGWQTGFALNPGEYTRDFGPTAMLSIVGYEGLWTFNNWYWLWTPCLGTFTGAILGGLFYDAFIYTGDDSPINFRWSLGRLSRGRGRRRRSRIEGVERDHQA